MQDTKHVMNENGLIVLAMRNGDLDTVDGLETAMQVSLFTDARLDETEMIEPFRRGGWVGNQFTDRQLGGKLYALENTRITTAYVGKATDFAKKSFDWMIEDNVSRGVLCRVSAQGQDVKHNISMIARDGVRYDYRYLWLKTRPFDLSIAP